jgi:hypothetical protein
VGVSVAPWVLVVLGVLAAVGVAALVWLLVTWLGLNVRAARADARRRDAALARAAATLGDRR